jgi:hypothetical protein
VAGLGWAGLTAGARVIMRVHARTCTQGVRCLGARCLSEHGQLRPRGSAPQALLLLSVCTGLAVVFFLFQLPALLPRYATFGCGATSTTCVLGGGWDSHFFVMS